jgi:tripartite-type tricarboxylate transporter receptor subunit TctC
VVDSPEFAERTRSLGIDAKSMTPHELDLWFDKELVRWTEIAKEANLKPE